MRFLFQPLLAAALALAFGTDVLAQSASSIPVKNANGSTVSVAGQNDSNSAFHYRDVMEGLQTDGTPRAIWIDASGQVYVHVVDLPSITLGAGAALIGGVKLYDAGGTNQAVINSSGQLAIQAPPSLPLPTGAASAALQAVINGDGGSQVHVQNWPTTQATSAADGQIVTEGATTDGACSTDTGTCTQIALVKRQLQRLTTLITNLGSPFQAGGSIGNTGFTATQGGNWSLSNANNAIGDVGSATLTAACTTLTLPSGGGTYASGQLAANSATAGSVTPLSCVVARYSGGPITVTKARIATSTTGASGEFYVHLYTSSPTVTNGNAGTFLSTTSGHFCRVDVNLEVAFSDGADGSGVPLTGNACTRVLSATQTIYALIEARSAYAWTAAQTITVTLEGYN